MFQRRGELRLFYKYYKKFLNNTSSKKNIITIIFILTTALLLITIRQSLTVGVIIFNFIAYIFYIKTSSKLILISLLINFYVSIIDFFYYINRFNFIVFIIALIPLLILLFFFILNLKNSCKGKLGSKDFKWYLKVDNEWIMLVFKNSDNNVWSYVNIEDTKTQNFYADFLIKSSNCCKVYTLCYYVVSFYYTRIQYTQI